MTHDPLCDHDDLCPMKHEQFPKHPLENCWRCDLIAKVRQDERERAGIEQTVPSYEYPFTTRVRQATPDDGQSVILASECEKRIAETKKELVENSLKLSEVESAIAAEIASREMLAKCIAAVEALKPLISVSKYDNGYDCCGCSTPGQLHDDALSALRELQEQL